MAQTGVPFGEIPAVRDWMGLKGEVKKAKSGASEASGGWFELYQE